MSKLRLSSTPSNSVSQVIKDLDTAEAQDQLMAENELSDPEACNKKNKGMPVRTQMSPSQALSWNKQQEWLPMETISGDDNSGSKLTAEQLFQWSSDGGFNLDNLNMLLWMLTFSHCI